MKKVIALILALAMVLSISAVALADEKPVKLSIMKSADDSVYDPVNNPALAKILEVNNIELELHMVDDITQSVNLAMASGELCDIIASPKLTVMEYMSSGYVLPLNDLLDQYGQDLKARIPEAVWEFVTLGGDIYAIPQENKNYKWPTAIRMDWVEKLGYEKKTEYTVSELKQILIDMATKDPDGNGENDTYGMNAYGGGWKNTNIAIYGAFNGIPDQNYLSEDGYIYSYNTSDDFRAALTYLNELWTAGAIDPEFFVASEDQATQKAANGKIGYFTSWWNGVKVLCENGFADLNPDAWYDVIYVTSDDGKTQGVLDNGRVSNSTFITTTCKNPEAAMKFLNYLATDEGYELFQYGWEGLHFEYNEDGTTTSIYQLNKDYLPLTGLVKWQSAGGLAPLKEDATRAQQMIWPFENTQHILGLPVYQDLFYGLPTTQEALEYATEVSNYVTSKVVEFVTGATPINDETWAAYKTDWAAKGGMKVLESYAKQYNELNKSEYPCK